MYTALVVIIVFGLLVTVHELGHFLVGKAVGIRIYEFSIGFGPKLFSFRKGETLYSLRLLPLGGYNKMAGMDDDEDLREIKKMVAEQRGISVDDITEEEEESLLPDKDDQGAFKNKTVLQRMAVIFAGSFNNFVLAFILLFLMFFVIGGPVQTTTVEQVMKDRPAQAAGLKAGDRIIAINGKEIKDWEQLSSSIINSGGKNLHVSIIRNGQRGTLSVVPKKDQGRFMIGMVPKTVFQRQPVTASINYAYQGFKTIFGQISHVLGLLFVDKRAVNQLGGPVSLVRVIGEAAKSGLLYILWTTAAISINLGIFNLLPIPALDGSRLVFLAFEGLRGKPVDPNKENMVHLVGFALLLLLMVVFTYRDIVRAIG